MDGKIEKRQIKKNIGLSISVQILSLLVSFIVNLIVPKSLDMYQYAYWQTFLLYASYVGLLHFGLLDGIVLRYSQYDYESIDKKTLASQFEIMLLVLSCVAILGIFYSLQFCEGTMQIIMLFVACSIVTKNIFTYTSYTFQITNRINKYAILVLCQRVFYGLFIAFLINLKVQQFYWYCMAEIFCDLFAFIFGLRMNKGLYFNTAFCLRLALEEVCKNIVSGIKLLVANWSSMFLVGSAKMIIQWHWDPLTFGKVTFAFSVSNLFLTFITAISVVLFPSLKRMDQEQLPQIYREIRKIISPLLFGAMLFYFPGCWILNKWLPQYKESLSFLGILLPVIVYTSKVSLLTNNYLKAFRKENLMFLINTATVGMAMIGFWISAYSFNNLLWLLFMVVVFVILRSVISEIVAMKIMKIRLEKEFVIEALLTFVFIGCASSLPLMQGFCVYLFCFIVYILRCATKKAE